MTQRRERTRRRKPVAVVTSTIPIPITIDGFDREQLKILEMATTLITVSGCRDIDITNSGWRPGEKISEDLFSSNDRRATTDPLVSSVEVPTLRVSDVPQAVLDNHKAAAAWRRHQATPSATFGV